MAFSCRERAGRSLQKPHDLAREAVNCNAGLGGLDKAVHMGLVVSVVDLEATILLEAELVIELHGHC